MTNINNSQTSTTTHYTHFTPHPPIIHLPQHNGTVNRTQALLSKSKLKLTSRNTAKNLENIEAIILSHFHQDTDILCLQELPNTPQLDPSLNLTMYCNVASDHTHGVAIILPNYLSTFSKLVKHPNIHDTLIGVENTLPGFPPFYILNVYKSHITSTQQRLADTLSKLQLNDPSHILTGDFNTHLQPFLDTDNVRHPKEYPWPEHQIHPPNSSTIPNPSDLFRFHNLHFRQWTRPKNLRLPDSQSRIDLILASTPFITLFLPHSTHINHSLHVTDHRPVSTYISIPTNPISIYNIPNTSVFYRAPNAPQLSAFHKHLSSLDSWMHNQLPNMDSAPTDELALLTEHTSTSLVNTYKLTTQQGHPQKPTSTEKNFTSAVLASSNSTINTATRKKLQNVINKWKQKKGKAIKKMSPSLTRCW